MTDDLSIMNLPDESEYPKDLTEEYELLERLAFSEESETLLVRRKKDDLLCAAKCYPSGSPFFNYPGPESLKTLDAPPMPRFVREVRSESMRCVLREYVEGENLLELSKTHTFSTEEVQRTGIQLCEQLSALHAQNPPVIHRDIKPGNVIMRADGTAVLIDFGIARESEHPGVQSDTVAFGTRGFAPPEQYGFRQTDARSDIYSLGVLLTYLLYKGTSLPDEDSNPLDPVIRKCISFDPDRRYRSAAEVKEALEAAPEAWEMRRDSSAVSEDAQDGRNHGSEGTQSGRNQEAAGAQGATQAPEAGSQRKWLRPALAVLAAACCIGIAFGNGLFGKDGSEGLHFQDALIEEAARANLGIDASEPLTEENLAQVKGLYIVADRAFATADEFYAGVNEWYGTEERQRGPVADLSDLASMPNLEQICIAAEEIGDLTPCGELSSLNKIEVKENNISDISVLSGMTALTSVGINGNPVQDISPLEGCPNLAFLDLCNVRTYEEEVIGKLGNFDYLDISNPTASYRYLDGKSILSLRVAWTGLTDLNDLSGVDRLEDLDMGHTSVTDLSPLTVHAGLKRLNIAAVPAEDLSVLLELPLLESVTVSADMQEAVESLPGAEFEIHVE